MVRPTPAPVSAPILPAARRTSEKANGQCIALTGIRKDRRDESEAAKRNPHFTAPQPGMCQDFGLEGFAWGVYVLLSKVDGPCGRCMVWAMVLWKWWTESRSVACDAPARAGPMDFGGDCVTDLGRTHVQVLSIWTTMIPRYSFPAAQQAQISEHLLSHSRGFWLTRYRWKLVRATQRDAVHLFSFKDQTESVLRSWLGPSPHHPISPGDS